MNEPQQHLEPMRHPAANTGTGSPLKVAFWTLGCRLNQYDTESIKAAMAARYRIDVVAWNQAADLYILNSCTVTGKADQECRRLARQVKRRQPDSRVVVAGCYAQTQPDALSAIEEIDGVVGNTAKEDIDSWLPEVLAGAQSLVAVADFEEHPVFDSPLVESFSGRSRAFVKIQDGCDLRCTYCLIWKARGPGRSRPLDEVMQQLGMLVEAGFPETILAGIHLGGYGKDLEPRVLLPELLRRSLSTYPELRIRLSSIHPNEVTPELLALFSEYGHLRPHLHISLQSGSDGVLKRMKRPYRGQRAWQAIGDAAAVAPSFGLGADIIVGFPGETDEEFEETRRMVQDLPFSYLHVFRFSARPGTAAADLPDQVHPETISRRSEILRKLADEKQNEFTDRLIGTTREAVIESASAQPGWREATTDNYLSILVPDRLPAGSVAEVQIDRRKEGILFASLPGE
jgi:threonylcarbamoyladenosine tRNA methylthiotransferase MtaB